MKASKFVLTAIVISLSFLSSTAYAQDQDERYLIGFLSQDGREAFIDEMTELGYEEGENISYMLLNLDGFDATVDMDSYVTEFDRQRQAMIDAGVDVFVTGTDDDAASLMQITEIPAVFALSIDPVASGAVTDLVNPGGTVTGIIANKPHERRLQLLTEVIPGTQKIYYPYVTFMGGTEDVLQEVEALAASLGIEVVSAPLSDLPTALAAINNIPDDADWVFITNFTNLDYGGLELLLARTTEQGVALAWVTDEPIQGVLMGYGPSVNASYQQAASIVDRILRGANPSELPVQTAENYLMVNLETAQALNIEIPEIVLRQASTIIRPGDLADPETASQ